jgi:hypothetical protein
MINLAQRLARAESDADKNAFVNGLVGQDKKAGEMKVAAGFVAGYLLPKIIKKHG